MEKLEYFFTNPYAWLYFVFLFSLPYVITYTRRFYSKELQKKMEKEEACAMEFYQKPEMKRMRKIVFIGFVLSVSVSYIISYFLMDKSCDTSRTFINIFLVLATPIMIYAMVVEYKNGKNYKNKKCSKIYTRREIIIQIGIYGGLIVLFIWLITSGIGKIR